MKYAFLPLLIVFCTQCITTPLATQIEPENPLENKDYAYVMIKVAEENQTHAGNVMTRYKTSTAINFKLLSLNKKSESEYSEQWNAQAEMSGDYTIYELIPGKYRIYGLKSNIFGYKPSTKPFSKSIDFEAKSGCILYVGDFETKIWTDWGMFSTLKSHSIQSDKAKKALITQYPHLKKLKFESLDKK